MSRSFWFTAVAALLFGLFAAWWWSTFELRDVKLRAPLSGEARINPLYGLQQVLRARDFEVDSRGVLKIDALPDARPALLVLSPDLRGLSDAASDALLSWVERGGDLLISLPPGSDGRTPRLLEQLGLWSSEHSSCIDWKLPEPAKKPDPDLVDMPSFEELLDPFASGRTRGRFCSEQRLHSDDYEQEEGSEGAQRFDWTWGNSYDGYVFARLRHGAGQIVISAQLDFLRTEALRQPANQALAWQLLGPSLQEGTHVQLVYAADMPPLHVLLVQHGWPILLPLLLGLLAWLWARSQRFGPLLPQAAAPRRALREHLRAAAELSLRRGRGSALLGPLRRRYLNRLSLRAPALAALPAAELAAALAQRHGLPVEKVDAALFDSRIHRPAALAEAVRILHRLSQES
jgi:hypothetical protein